MKKRFQIGPVILAAATCLAFGAVAQEGSRGKPSARTTGGKALKASDQTLEEYLTREKVISHGKERQALWTALRRVWLKAFVKSNPQADLTGKPIVDLDLYAENSSLTEICFRHRGNFYTFQVSEGRISPAVFAKVLPPINAITCAIGKEDTGSHFVLWCCGRPEACIDTAEK